MRPPKGGGAAVGSGAKRPTERERASPSGADPASAGARPETLWRDVFLALLRALVVFTVEVPCLCFGAIWTRNDDDTLSAVTTPSGTARSVHYTTSGPQRLLSEVRLDGATVAQLLRRDGNLRANRVHFGGGRQLHGLRYDRMGRLDKRWTSTSTALNPPALTWEGDFDDRGRLVAEHVTTGSITDTSSYTYAEPGWLTDEQHTRGGAD